MCRNVCVKARLRSVPIYVDVPPTAAAHSQWNEASTGSTDGTDGFTTSLQMPLPPEMSNVLAAKTRLCVRDNRKIRLDAPSCGPWSDFTRYQVPKNDASMLAQLDNQIQQIVKAEGELAFSLAQEGQKYQLSLASTSAAARTNIQRSLLLQAHTFAQFPDTARQLMQNPDKYQQLLQSVQTPPAAQSLALADTGSVSACLPTDANAISNLPIPDPTVTQLETMQVQTLTYSDNGTITTTVIQVDPSIATTVTLNSTITVTINGTETLWNTVTTTVHDTETVHDTIIVHDTETVHDTQPGTTTSTGGGGGISTGGVVAGALGSTLAFAMAIGAGVKAWVQYKQYTQSKFDPTKQKYEVTSRSTKVKLVYLAPTETLPLNVTEHVVYDLDGTLTTENDAKNYYTDDEMKLKEGIGDKLRAELREGKAVTIATGNRVNNVMKQKFLDALRAQITDKMDLKLFDRIAIVGIPPESTPVRFEEGKALHIEMAEDYYRFTNQTFASEKVTLFDDTLKNLTKTKSYYESHTEAGKFDKLQLHEVFYNTETGALNNKFVANTTDNVDVKKASTTGLKRQIGEKNLFEAKFSAAFGIGFLVVGILLGVYASGAFNLADTPQDVASHAFIQALTDGYAQYQKLSAARSQCEKERTNEIATPGSGQVARCQVL